ncbi:MAG: kinase [Betaproteobacteria bacterium]|nr:kinase [Betaproteobacteria bacterium]
MRHIDPDHYLATPAGRVDSPDLARAARDRAYAALQAALERIGTAGRLYVVCGLQGAGKSTWIRNHAAALGDSVVCFDGALPSRRHRSRALALCGAGRHARGVRVDQRSLAVALQRNAARTGAERIAEATIRHVWDQLEPPSVAEGFVEVVEIGTAG